MNEPSKKTEELSGIAKTILDKLIFFKNKLNYARESIKNRYPCSLVKYEVINKKYFVYYCVLGRKDNLHRLAVDKILDDQMLLEKFHPKDATIMGFIAGIEIFSNTPSEKQTAVLGAILSDLMSKGSEHDL